MAKNIWIGTPEGDVHVLPDEAGWVAFGVGGDDVITGGDRNDDIRLGVGNDVGHGGAGNDIVYGEDGNDTIAGGAGNDSLGGGTKKDDLDGGAGNDLVTGGWGSDLLVGGIGNDTLLVGGANGDASAGKTVDIVWCGERNGTNTEGTDKVKFEGLLGQTGALDVVLKDYVDPNGTQHGTFVEWSALSGLVLLDSHTAQGTLGSVLVTVQSQGDALNLGASA